MNALEVLQFFHARSPWVKLADTVDRVIVGEACKPVSRILVTWMPTLAAVKAAIDGGYDMLMGHEPVFYHHTDYRENPQDIAGVPIAMAKKKLIEDSGLVVVRNHDSWDRFPEVGVPFAWAKFLGFHTAPVAFGAADYQHRYDIAPISFEELARRVVQRTARLGEPAIQICGDGSRMVSRIGVGTGCCTQPPIFREMGCDASIVSDDGTWYWCQLQRAEDEGHPFIRVHHGTSEEPAMATLTDYINANIPGVQATHLPHRAMFRTVTA